MLTILIFLFFLIIPLLYCLHRGDLKLFVLYSVFTFWVPISLPFPGIFEQITIPEFFIYAGTIFYFFNKNSLKKTSSVKINSVIKFAFVLLLIGCFTSMFNSINSKFLFIGFRQTFIMPLAFLYVFSRIDFDKHYLGNISFAFIISILILLATLYLHPKTFSFQQYRGASQELFRLGGEYLFLDKYTGIYYEATVGAFLGFMIPFIITFYRIEKRAVRKFIYICGFIIMSIAIVLAAGRSGWVAMAVGLIVIYLGSLHKGQRFFTISLTVILTISIIFLISGVIAPTFAIEGKFFERITSFASLDSAPNLLVRVYQWIWAWDVFLKNPFGIGFWNFTVITNSLFAGNSTWITMLLNIGIIGTIGFSVLFFYSLFIALKNIFSGSDSIIYIGLFASLISFSIGATTENLFDAGLYTTLPFWLIIGIIHNLNRNNHNSNSTIG